MGLSDSEDDFHSDRHSPNPGLDLFLVVTPRTGASPLINYLKLTCNLRGVRGTRESDEEGFFTAAGIWLHSLLPKALALNMPSSVEFECFKYPSKSRVAEE